LKERSKLAEKEKQRLQKELEQNMAKFKKENSEMQLDIDSI